MKMDGQRVGDGVDNELEYLHQRVLELEHAQAKWKEKERTLQASEALLREIAVNYPNSYMSIIKKDLTVGFTSGQEFKKLNLNPEDFIGLTLEQVFREQTPIVREYYLRTFSGEEVSFELFIDEQHQLYKTTPLINEAGEIEHILVVVENITDRKQTDIALRESEERYRTLFETMAQGVVYHSPDGKIISGNPAAERILGLTLDQLRGRTSMDPRWRAIHEDGTDFPGETHPGAITLKTGKPVRDVVMGVFHSKENDYRWININSIPQFLDGDDKFYQVYATFEDITERKRAEAQVERVAQEWRITFDAISDGIFLMDAQYKIIRCNQVATEMLGESFEEILGRRCWELIHNTTERVKSCPLLQLKDSGARGEEALLLKGRWLNICIDPIFDEAGSLIGSVHVMTDVTEKKQADEILQQRTYELAERVKELNCLYSISTLIEKPAITFDQILQGTVELLPSGWQYPEITYGRITYYDHIFISKDFQETQWQQNCEILINGEAVGTIEVYCLERKPEFEEGPFLEEERNLLNAIAQRVGRVIERQRAKDELTKLATTDPLTGLFNRRYFFEFAEKELERSRRYEHPLSCIMFDLDFFKEVNDSYGHIFGDQVLIEVVRLCQLSLRQVDIFARFGGDEFIILLPETNSSNAQQVAKRLQESFEKTKIEITSHKIMVTLSVGLASVLVDEDETTLDTLVAHADQALYQSKRRGRNQISVWKQE